jgi:hypothetical protein
MTRSGVAWTDEADGRIAALFLEAGLTEVADRIAATVAGFDEGMLAAAAAAMPERPGALATLMDSAIGTIPFRAGLVPPQLLTSAALGRIRGALELIDRELESYLADRDRAHLQNVFGDGMQNLYQVLRHCLGFWRLPRDPAGPVPIRKLRLELGVCDGQDVAAGPALRLLVDGQELLADVSRRRYTAFPAAELLGIASPLLPADPARFVPLYRAAPGSPAGCIAAVIHSWGDRIAWNAFRHFDGDYSPAMQPEPADGWPVGSPRVFDGAQYRAEVRRISLAVARSAGDPPRATP